MNSKSIFLSFFKVGVIGFGGGSALIPVVEREIVENRGAMDAESYLKHTVVANITPGALPIKLGATCGYQLGGVAGSLLGAYGVMLPGALLTIAIVALFSTLGSGVIRYFNYASVGITAFIVFLLASYIIKSLRGDAFKVGASLCAGSFVLTGGGELRHFISQLFGIDGALLGTPLFDISTIDLMIATFFMILVLDKLRSRFELCAAFAVVAAFAVCSGKMVAASGAAWPRAAILAIMAVLLITLFILRRKPATGKKSGIPRSAIVCMGLFVAIPVVMTLAAALFFPLSGGHSVWEFILNVCISTVTSFGGGEAYVSVADGFFVQGGYIQPDLFYTQLVPIANTLPGPILSKIASGVGYLFGAEQGSPAAGWFLALTCGAAALGMCSAIAVLVMNIYDSISESVFIKNLKKYIIPVICGMLISTSLSMIYESMKVTSERSVSAFIAFPLIVAWIFVLHFLHKKLHLHDIILLLGSAGVSIALLLI